MVANTLEERYPLPCRRITKMLEERTHEEDGCRIWDGTLNTSGRPLARDVRGRLTTVQRIVHEREEGHIPKGRIVMLCGNARCVNPAHFTIDTSKRGMGRVDL